MSYVAFVNTARGMKSISLRDMSPDAFRTLMGKGFGDGDGDIVTYYESVPWLRRGIDVVVGAMENLPLAIMNGDDEKEIGELGITTDLQWLLGTWTLWFLLFGATYGVASGNRVRSRTALQPWHPSTVTPVYDDKEGVTSFKRTIGSKTSNFPTDEVMYVWEYNAGAEVGPGKARAAAALQAAGLLSNVDKFSTALFANGAISPMIIEVPTGTTEGDKEQIQSWVNRTMVGIKNAFRPLVVRGGDQLSGMGGFKNVQLGSPPKDLTMPELTQAKREDISTALGVPQSILFSNATSGTSSQQDKLNLYDETVLPLFWRFARPLNDMVFKPMGVELVEQHNQLEIYQRQETAKAYGLAQLWTTNAVTREYLHDMLELPDMYREGTYYVDIAKAAQSNQSIGDGVNGKPLAKPPDLPDVPTIDAPEADDMKADLDRWRRVAVKRMKEGKPEKALNFDSDAIPAAMAGAIRGRLKNIHTPDDLPGVFAQALAWGVYP